MDLNLIDDKGQKASTVAGIGRAVRARLQRGADPSGRHGLPGERAAGHARAEGPQRHQQVARKPWNQKGTGRARAGQANSPLWRGGGKIFPSSPDENFSHKVNRKMYRAGIASILSQLVREDRLSVIDALALDSPKTKLFAQKIKGYGFTGTVLVVTEKLDENVFLSRATCRTCWCSRRAKSIR